MPLRRYWLALIALLYTTLSIAQNKVSVYVVAHPDDWQLFMGNDAYADIQDTTNKVIFIITTAGDATGKKEKPDMRYARSRERGVLNSVRFCADMSTTVDSACQTRHVTLNGHKIFCYPYKHVKTYFLRLPDGCFSSGFNGQSLEYLHDGRISSIMAIDSSETYESWNDLVQTIRTIAIEEAKGYNDITINYQDHDRQINPNDHPDHLFSGLAASQATTAIPMVKYKGYMDYDIAKRPANLNNEEIAIKAGIFALADFGITEQGDGTSFDKKHLAFLSRTYSRKFPSVDSAGNPFYPPYVTVFPNPAKGNSVQVLFALNTEEQVQLWLKDINGNLVWMETGIPTIKGDNTFTIPLDQIPAGVYFISLITSSGTIVTKLVRI